MFRPNSFIKLLKHQESSLGSTFNLLCWNVAKLTLHSSYKKYIDSLILRYDLDILLLQEVKKSIADELEFHDFSYVLSPNIETKKHIFGVLSAFKTSCEKELSLLTKKQELFYMTHKVSLITHHKIRSQETLLIVNLHAINFVNNLHFKHELDTLYAIIRMHKGAMIVAGDFNTWNRSRIRYLEEFTQKMSLQKVEFKDEKHLKKIFANSIDYIFYRDMEVTFSEVIDSKKISDHNPIIAQFRC